MRVKIIKNIHFSLAIFVGYWEIRIHEYENYFSKHELKKFSSVFPASPFLTLKYSKPWILSQQITWAATYIINYFLRIDRCRSSNNLP